MKPSRWPGSRRLVPIDYLAGASCLLPEPRTGLPAADLTPAERAVFALIRAGCPNKEIAAVLGKAEPTVKHQVSSILRKTGQPSRARLIATLR